MRKKLLFILLFLLLSSFFSALSAQVKVQEPSSTDESNLFIVLDQGIPRGVLSRELLVEEDGRGQVVDIFYLQNRDGTTNYEEGFLLDRDERIIWNLDKNSFSRKGTKDKASLYISKDGQITRTAIPKASLATLTPLTLEDKRAEETIYYPLVKVASLIWMRSNLATLFYQDGSPIPTGLSKKSWMNTTEGAVTQYQSKEKELKTRGALYNWYAVSSSKGLAPKGWRVSSDEDWHKCVKYLDPKGFEPNPDDPSCESSRAGLKMKSSTQWKKAPYPEPGAVLKQGNNLSGLDMAPYGSTSISKYFDYSGDGLQAYFWTSTPYRSSAEALFRRMYWDSDIVNRFFEKKYMGYAVRCLLDAKDLLLKTPKVEEATIAIENKLNEQTSFIFRAISQSGKIKVTNNQGKEYLFDVDKNIKTLSGGMGTLVSIPPSKDNQSLLISGDLLYLDLSGQHIANISIQKATKLQALILNKNELASLMLPELPSLKLLYAHSNSLEKIDLSKAPSLIELVLLTNNLSSIDLSHQKELLKLGIAYNKLSSLPLQNNLKLTELDCQRNQLPSLEIAHLTNLKSLNCTKNKIQTLDIKNNIRLEILYCGENKIKKLDLSLLNKLQELNCNTNNIKAIELKGKRDLRELYAFSNQIEILNFSDTKNIQTISIGDNVLRELYFEKLSYLKSLSAPFNQLSSFKISDCPLLEALSLMGNKLSNITIEKTPALVLLEVNNNQITEPIPLVEQLPNHKESPSDPAILIFFNKEEYPDLEEGNKCTDTFVQMAKAKGWKVLDGQSPLSMPSLDDPSKIEILETSELLSIKGLRENTRVRVYSISGYLVDCRNALGGELNLFLPRGKYVLMIDGFSSLKVVKR